MVEVLLNGDQIEELAGDGSRVLIYPELYKYKSIEELFSNGIKKNLILYLQDKQGNDYSGHWVALTKHNDIVTFMDPYGIIPDNQIDWNPKDKQKRLNQDENYLTRLLHDYSRRGGIVEYNEMRFQKRGSNINTCGRHAGIWSRFHEVPLVIYQNMFKKLRENGHNLDEVSVELSDPLIN